VYVYINDTFNKIDCGGFTNLYCGIKNNSNERKVIGRKHVVIDVGT
jgi:tRNA-binding EMAP/Myf-like protein